MSKGRLYLLFALLLFVLGCVGCVYYLINRNNIDPFLQELYEKKALQETLLAKQIAENKKIEAMLESGRQSEEIYRIEKNNIQEKINAYIHNKTIKDESLFTQELETPKTSNKKTQENISEQVLKQELGLLTE